MAKIIKPGLRSVDLRAARPIEKRADPELLTAEHRAWRDLVLQRAVYQCEAVDNGRRCSVRFPSRLFADHIIERKDGGAPLDVRNGQCLCGKHHSLKTAAARAERMKVRY
ncbi:HNH endonuclease signature motif containing protein [Mesorhizobium sp. B2-4-6]|uniref:HNH endonuclease signature motif containing protein n=1 Tax=Mesorhizobium sp. B2-4-6 TaxID=2589943 RepID=UPI001126442C|nr:HNH endonuclease signature motif containing protein [Mesorhizobium sp. B2-4-6]TPL40678.1 HNH endonuclease [Mesorhizobium sp. B2-4-6]